MGKWVAMVHIDIKIAVMACAIWKMEGLTEKQVRVSLASFMTVPMAELKCLL